MKKQSIKQLITLQSTKFLNLYKVIYQNKMGQEKSWFVASRKSEEVVKKRFFENEEDKPDAVLIMAIHEETGKMVLIKQFRVPINDYIYELPAGLIDGDEVAELAVERELREETGLKLKAIDHAQSSGKLYLSPGMTDESIRFIRCTCTGELSTQYLEADEDITPMLVSKEEAKAILASGEHLDVKAFILLQEYIL